MPISYTEVASTGDVLPNNRAVLYFPSLPGSFDGRDLTLRHTSVNLPPLQIGQTVVKLLGWSIAFASIRTQQNTFTTEFVETVGGPVVKTLASWQEQCAGFRSHLSKMKADYAVNCQCIAYDTAGEKALITNLYGVWPINVTYGQHTEDSSPAMVQVDFSVDFISLADVITNNQDYQPSSQPSSPSLWYQPIANTNNAFSGINTGIFNISPQVANSLGLTPSNAATVLNGFY